MVEGDAAPDGALLPEVFEAIGTARAMRWFRPDPVPVSLVERVVWAGTRASSPNNCQPWDFVVVRDPELRARIGALFAPLTSPGAIDAITDPTERRTVEGAMNLLGTLADVPVLIFVCGRNIYPPHDPDERLMYSALYAASQNMIVAARALGLGAAFTTFHRINEPDIRTLLQIPDDRSIAVTLPLGWPARAFGPLTRRPVEEVLHIDRW
ncbi:MAG: nitroreductase family protein [Acidimicrobiia bacterium]